MFFSSLSKSSLFFIFYYLVSLSTILSQNKDLSSFRWTTLETKGEFAERHESSLILHKNKFYLIGGRGKKPINVFDPNTNQWETKKEPPIEIHHFQAVSYKNAIYIVGAMSGKYPIENPIKNIWIYYPENDKWEKSTEIPENRRRGAAGVAIFQDKIYLVGGIDFGHTSGTNNLFDSYDLLSKKWRVLTKAPNIRDHFSAIVVNDKLYCFGGRNTSYHTIDNFGAFFNKTIPDVDVYNFKEEKWHTLKEQIPFPTAGSGVVNYNNKIIFIGGEGTWKQAYNTTQVFDLDSNKWSLVSSLNIGRHSGGFTVYNNKIYAISGSPNKGGGNLKDVEVFAEDHDWKKIFNGKNFDGWEIKGTQKDIDKNFWTVNDDAILSNSLNSENHEHVWLQSIDEYDNFELRLKFKASKDNKGNSGIQIRSRFNETAVMKINDRVITGWMDGPQIDIDPNKPWTNGFIYNETRGYTRWINPSLESWKIDKEKYAPQKVIYYQEDEETGWNNVLIICKGTSIKTIINNVVVSDYDGKGILDDQIHKNLNVGLKGKIALQCHMNSKNKIWFKDIEIRELH
jgi:N-acetylneuraminic acid mutarotase